MMLFDTPNKGWSHLISDSITELHSFAQSIGLKREWFQDKPGRPHYDIKTDMIRRRAEMKGANMVSRSHLLTKLKEWHGKAEKSETI